jgi:hypothetical protein
MKKQIKLKMQAVIACLLMAVVFCPGMSWAAAPEASYDDGTLLLDSELSLQSGQGINPAAIRSDAQVTGNIINVSPGGSFVNGNNVVGDHALTDVNGIPTIVQNSGNNVVIQNSTIVNMTFQ